MNVPLSRLYNFLHDTCNRDLLIYRFSPDGSKNIEDLTPLIDYQSTTSWFERVTTPVMFCYDQEPLNFDLYSSSLTNNFALPDGLTTEESDQMKAALFDRLNIRFLKGDHFLNGYDKYLLCHSEKNSPEVAKYESAGFAGVYWWCHALIALDWFRFANSNTNSVSDFTQFSKDFLVYNRAWSGTREYRLKFAELVVENQLVDNCNIKFAPTDDGQVYTDHVFVNPELQITSTDLENVIPLNTAGADASADILAEDYRTIGIEVVLETLFDDQRQQLTEKAIRPLAAGCPFILVSTPGSLQYLRDYGFQTFSGLIDETYDTIVDPKARLEAIVAEMKRISELSNDEKTTLWTGLYEIAAENKTHLFSDNFSEQVVNEFKTNFDAGIEQVLAGKTGSHMKYVKSEWLDKYPDFATGYHARPHRTMEEFNQFLTWIETP
jgi:hypothetical protein